MSKKASELDKKVNAIYEEYKEEYDTLADKSEKLFDKQEALDEEREELKKSYEKLEKITGMNVLIQEGGEIKRLLLNTKESLQIGDKIKILSIPQGDINDKAQQERNGGLEDEFDFYTSDVIEEIIEQNPVVVIDYIDEFGNPWFSIDLKQQGEKHHHTIAIMEDASWERLKNKN